MTPAEPPPPAAAIPAEFDDAVVWAAWLYYEDQLTQGEIARMLGVSRASIVNYLQEARRRGVVRILMNAEVLARTTVARDLAAKFGLREALVIPRGEAAGSAALLPMLGAAGARLLERMIRPGQTICVSWGRTVLAIADAIALPRPVEGLSVVQVTGSSIGKAEFSAELCTSILARNLGAVSVNMLSPAVLTTAALRDALMQEPVLRRQFGLIAGADMIVFGVGSLEADSTMRFAEITSDAEIDAYAEAGAVAVLICRFLDPTGRQVARDFDRRMIGIELEELRAVPQRICVAGGLSKVEAIRATLRGGFATHLVTDMEVAERLLAE